MDRCGCLVRSIQIEQFSYAPIIHGSVPQYRSHNVQNEKPRKDRKAQRSEGHTTACRSKRVGQYPSEGERKRDTRDSGLKEPGPRLGA